MVQSRNVQLVVLGAAGVGKSAITARYVNNIFLEEYDPTIEDSYRVQRTIDGVETVMDILDTAGTEQFTAMRSVYMKDGQGFILVFSITQPSSYKFLPGLFDDIRKYREDEKHVAILLGNKSDLEGERELTVQQGQEIADHYGCQYIEVSAKTGHGIAQAFETLCRGITTEILKPLESQQKSQKKGGFCLLL